MPDISMSMLGDEEFDINVQPVPSSANFNGEVTVVSNDTDILVVVPFDDGTKNWTLRATGEFGGDVTVTVSDTVNTVTVSVSVGPVEPSNATDLLVTPSPVRKKVS